MLAISGRAMNQAMEKMAQALMSKPDLVSRIGGRGTTSNQEFLDLIRSVFAINDPLILDAHRRLLESFQQPVLMENETMLGSQIVVYMWYGALRIEEELNGQRVPLLRRERLEELLPSFYVPPGTTMTMQMSKEEYGTLGQFMTPIHMFSQVIGTASIEVAFLYPLLALTRLLNDAATSPQS
jgi:hypothetical protein